MNGVHYKRALGVVEKQLVVGLQVLQEFAESGHDLARGCGGALGKNVRGSNGRGSINGGIGCVTGAGGTIGSAGWRVFCSGAACGGTLAGIAEEFFLPSPHRTNEPDFFRSGFKTERSRRVNWCY